MKTLLSGMTSPNFVFFFMDKKQHYLPAPRDILRGQTHRSMLQQLIISLVVTCLTCVICYLLVDYIGYRAVALIMLFAVSFLAIILSVYPVLMAAVLSALIWDFFFIPPHFTFHIEKPEDILMLVMYFMIALLNGILTSRIRHYEKHERLREEKFRALKLYNTLFNSLSHELRTPITTIMGASETLMSQNLNIHRAERAQLSQEAFKAAERLNRLVDNLLNQSRLESGLLQPKPDWCDIGEVIHSVVDRLKAELTKHMVEVDIAAEIPLVRLDAGLFEQVLINLVHNIALHTPEGTKGKIKADMDHDRLVISVEDNGPGFVPKDQDHVFDKFYRASTAKPGGLGLGLSIARGFVQAMNGTIRLENIKSGGSCFRITLPVEKNPYRQTDEE